MDVKKLIEDAWVRYIKGSPNYLEIKKLLHADIDCTCHYPSDKRPLDPRLFELYHGCVFDLDAYCDGKEEYLKKEINALPDTIYAGGISTIIHNFESKPKAENWYDKPINDETEVAIYLKKLMILIRAALDKEFEIMFLQKTITHAQSKESDPMVV